MNQTGVYTAGAMTGRHDKDSVRSEIGRFLKGYSGNGQHAMLLVGLDNINHVNESMGKIFGDTIIQRIADGIGECISENDIAGRVGIYEFLIFLKERTREEIIDVAMKLNQMFCEIYTGEEESVRIIGSIGISIYPKDGKNDKELFYKADEAMCALRSTGKCWYQFYSHTSEENDSTDKENRYHMDIARRYSDCTEYDRELASFAFDILSSTKSFAGAVNALLDRVAKKYGLDRIRVMSINQANRAFEVVYLWENKIVVLPGEPQTHGHFGSIKELEDDLGPVGVIQINEVRQKDSAKALHYNCGVMGITAHVSCGIYNEEDKLMGLVSYEMNHGSREWKKEERDTFGLITKTMSHFLLVSLGLRNNGQELDKISNYDKVTGLYMQPSFKREVSRVLSTAQPGEFALVNSDFSNFKYINDIYGLEVGDKILKAFAEKVITNNRYCIAGCRVYADNFIALVHTSGKERLSEVIMNLNEEFEREQRLFYPDCNFRVHTGAYIIENPDTDLVQLLDGAALARKQVKENTNLKYCFFDDTLNKMMHREGKVLAEIKTAILERQLIPYLQPKFSLETNEVIGAEALVRWRVDEKTFYYPNDFIPVLEKTGNIIDVDFCIYHQVMETMRRWLDEGKKAVPVSVNISRMDCRHERLEQILIEMADRYQVPHNLIEIELTESAFFENADVLMKKLESLRGAGFIISIDDFGSGYSSLSVISRMPIDVIKMDQSFLRSGLLSESSAYVIEAMIHLAKRMNLDIICEGVETDEQIKFLLDCGCRMGQGYIFAKPMPVAEFEEKYL